MSSAWRMDQGPMPVGARVCEGAEKSLPNLRSVQPGAGCEFISARLDTGWIYEISKPVSFVSSAA